MLAFTKRLHNAGLDYDALSFLTNISTDRLREWAKGRGTLSDVELDRIDSAIRHKPVIYTLWKRAVEGAEPLTGSASK